MNRLPRFAIPGAALLAAAVLAGCCPTPPKATTPIAETPPVETPPVETPPVVDAPPTVAWESSGVAWDEPPPPLPEVAFTPPIPIEFTMPNGIRVLVVENHRLPLVSVRIAVASAGSRADGARAGLAALTADLLDEGAGKRTALELPEELERLGASLTVGAGTDHAQLTLDTMAATLPGALAVTADVLLRPTFAAADVTRVKAEHLADLATRGDQPTAIARLVFARMIYGAHPYGNSVDGTTASVTPLTRADVQAFWKRSYGPAATTIVIVGDVTVDAARALLTKSLGGWRNKVALAKAPPAAAPTAPTLGFVDRPGAPQSVVVIGRLGPDVRDPMLAARDLINTAVGGSFASRLNSVLREQKGYTYGISSTFVRSPWGGAWRATSQVRTDATALAITDALAILADTATEPMPAVELAKAKALMIRGLPQDFETNAGIAGQYLGAVLDGRPLTYFRDLPGQLAAVTAESARDGAATAWRDLSIVVVGDWAVIGADVTKLGLPIVRYDVDGNRGN